VLRVTDATYPVLCLQSVGRITRPEIDAVHPAYVSAYARRRPLIAVTDARLAVHDAAQRKLLAEWSAQTYELDKGCTLASIVMLDNPLLRGALVALNWLAPPPIKQHAVADSRAVLETGRAIAAAHGLEVPTETWMRVRAWIDEGYNQARTG
jgi:hypothetical protein